MSARRNGLLLLLLVLLLVLVLVEGDAVSSYATKDLCRWRTCTDTDTGTGDLVAMLDLECVLIHTLRVRARVFCKQREEDVHMFLMLFHGVIGISVEYGLGIVRLVNAGLVL